MTASERKYFELLKDKIVARMQESYPGIPDSISYWKGQNIIDFQSDLEFSLKQHLSEKWFYTHMKSDNVSLPRIDVLNFLSQYAGYRNWDDFKHVHASQEKKLQKVITKHIYYIIPVLVTGMITALYFIFMTLYTQEYTFCFYDSITRQSICDQVIEVTLLESKESDRNYICDANGCFVLRSNRNKIKFVVEAPYHHSDTIVRRLNSFSRTERIRLKVDDYAIMIHYFSNSKVEDWLNRREELNGIFSDQAKIYQIHEGSVGMEIYNKWEFINKLTLPSTGLRNIEILDTKYNGGLITHLCFIQNGTGQ